MNHTPGPWGVSKHGTPEAHPQFGVYAEGCNDHVIVKGDAAAADARLIAAAPELLAACEAAEPHIRGQGSAGALTQLRAAIAKAQGAT
jgi:hypothetical protein